MNFHNYISHLIKLFPVFLLLPATLLRAQPVKIIPQPDSVVMQAGYFRLDAGSVIGINDNTLLPVVRYFQQQLKTVNGLILAAGLNEQKANINLRIISGNKVKGAYTLNITPQNITISASVDEGIFYGLTSLLQLIRTTPDTAKVISIPAMLITDQPLYQWRGFMLDESRHFFGKEKVKQLLDWMAFYKLNKFHWHLTDANGWRVEIKKYPKLTTIGGIGNHSDTLAAAKFYTQDDIRDIVAYAKERFIDVIPEIDMPGHATAANRAYPEFSGGAESKYPNFTFDPANEATYSFLADILKEVNALFPYGMVHLGGDEVALGIQAWTGRPAIMEMMKRDSLHALSDLEHYFFRRMADTVFNLGSKTLCWDEAAESGLPAGKTIIFWWRQNQPQALQLALQNRYQVVLCPRLPLYFDFVQDKKDVAGRKWNGLFNSISDVYNFPEKQLFPAQSRSNQVLGIQANLWTETVGSCKRLDYLVFPRMAALAEAAWTNAASKNEADFNERLKTNFSWYDKAGIYYYNPFDPAFHPEAIDFKPDHPLFKPAMKHHHRKRRSKDDNIIRSKHKKHKRPLHLKKK